MKPENYRHAILEDAVIVLVALLAVSLYVLIFVQPNGFLGLLNLLSGCNPFPLCPETQR